MRKFLLTAILLFGSSASAAEITSRITDSVSLKVNPQITITEPSSASYTVSGSNIDVTTLGGVGTAGVYAINTNGQAYTFSETSAAAGTITTVQTAGTAGSLAGTLSGTTIPSVTAGGANTEAVGQRSVELSVFK
jgi:hypothetical protein